MKILPKYALSVSAGALAGFGISQLFACTGGG